MALILTPFRTAILPGCLLLFSVCLIPGQGQSQMPGARITAGTGEAAVRQAKERRERLKHELEEHPDSEDLRVKYVEALIAEKNFGEARSILAELKKRSPQSKRRAVLDKYINEVEALRGNQPPPEMTKRHMLEMFEAAQLDIAAHEASKPQAAKDAAQHQALPAAVKAAELRRAAVARRFPKICAEDTAKRDQETAALSFRSRLFELEREGGARALSEEYPKLMRVYPHMPLVPETYARFLVKEGRYDEAAKTVAEGLRKFPERAVLIVLEDGVKDIKSKRAEEQPAAAAKLQEDLAVLDALKSDCVKK